MGRDIVKNARRLKEKFGQNRDIYNLQRKAAGSLEENWEATNDESWNVIEYDYRLVRKDSNKKKDKEVSFHITLWSDDRGRVFADQHTKSLLKADRKLSIKVFKATAKYYDHFSGETEPFRPNIESDKFNDMNVSDVNSLIMINKFLQKISSGVRSPSDKDVALEMRQYMSSFLERNSISV